MNEKTTAIEPQQLATLPNSLREQLQRAQLLLNQSDHADAHGRPDIAYTKAQQAVAVMSALVARSAESGTLALLADMGCQGYEFETIEQIDTYTVLERRLFGLSFGQFAVPTRTVIRRASKGRVF